MKEPIHDDQDGFLEDLARHHHADADLPPEAAERLRRELGHRFTRQRARRRRVNTGLAASLVLVVSVLALRTDVISNALDVVFDKINSLGEPTFVSESTGERYNSPLDSTATVAEHQAVVQKVHDAKMAGEWEFYNIWGWTLDGTTCFIISWSVEVDEEIHNYSNIFPENRPESWVTTFNAYYGKYREEMSAAILAGEMTELPSATVEIDGVSYVFRKYTETYPEFGTVIVWTHIPED